MKKPHFIFFLIIAFSFITAATLTSVKVYTDNKIGFITENVLIKIERNKSIHLSHILSSHKVGLEGNVDFNWTAPTFEYKTVTRKIIAENPEILISALRMGWPTFEKNLQETLEKLRPSVRLNAISPSRWEERWEQEKNPENHNKGEYFVSLAEKYRKAVEDSILTVQSYNSPDAFYKSHKPDLERYERLIKQLLLLDDRILDEMMTEITLFRSSIIDKPAFPPKMGEFLLENNLTDSASLRIYNQTYPWDLLMLVHRLDSELEIDPRKSLNGAEKVSDELRKLTGL